MLLLQCFNQYLWFPSTQKLRTPQHLKNHRRTGLNLSKHIFSKSSWHQPDPPTTQPTKPTPNQPTWLRSYKKHLRIYIGLNTLCYRKTEKLIEKQKTEGKKTKTRKPHNLSSWYFSSLLQTFLEVGFLLLVHWSPLNGKIRESSVNGFIGFYGLSIIGLNGFPP